MKPLSHALLLLALSLGLSACASRRPSVAAPLQAPPMRVGQVVAVNQRHDFALVKTSYALPAGALLQARTAAGKESAQLRVSAEQKSAMLIADILKGKPLPGEMVTK